MTTYQYQGKRGEFFRGIPARDLSERDVARLSKEQVKTIETAKGLDGQPLYVKKSEPKKQDDQKGQKGDGKQPDPKQG